MHATLRRAGSGNLKLARKYTQNTHARKEGRKEGNVLFNDALNTFYLRLYGVGHMVKDHSDSNSVFWF